MYCASMALPKLLQSLFGYDALVSGLAMSPSGVSSMAAMVIAGILLSRQFDARWLMAAGLAAMAAGNYWMVRMNLQVSFWHVILPRMLLTLGLGTYIRAGQRSRLQIHPTASAGGCGRTV